MIRPTSTYTRLQEAGVELASSIYQRTPLVADTFLLDAVTWCCGKRTDLEILEVGTCRGVSSAILAQRGNVVTLDKSPRDGCGDALKVLDVAGKVVRVLGPPELARPLVRGKFDVCFIDATHKHENVLRDFAFAVARTNNVIFHDYCKDHPGIMAAVNEIHRKHGGEFQLFDCFAALRKLNG